VSAGIPRRSKFRRNKQPEHYHEIRRLVRRIALHYGANETGRRLNVDAEVIRRLQDETHRQSYVPAPGTWESIAFKAEQVAAEIPQAEEPKWKRRELDYRRIAAALGGAAYV
jgi:hypothetical protein